MMVQSTLLAVALLLSVLSYSSAEKLYCVTPTATLCSSCPHHYSHCATLFEYAQEAGMYFASNTTMVFLPGDHTLVMNITVTNATRLALHGKSSSGNRATIVCSGSVGLSFTSIVDFKIAHLVFTSCSRKHAIIIDFAGNVAIVYVALLLKSTQYAELVNCSFQDNDGTALLVKNTNIALAGNSEFAHNHVHSGDIIAGGGIIALSSNLMFTGNTSFFENVASCKQCTFEFVGGGAIFAGEYSTLSFNGITNFISNSAIGGTGGGAIITSDSFLSFNGINNFINNLLTAGNSGGGGGAICTTNTILNFNGTNNFINNLEVSGAGGGGAGGGGGAIITFPGTVLSFSGTNNFINNSAHRTASGGAIIVYSFTVLSFNGNNNFINNSAGGGGGGAIATFNTTGVSFNGISMFIKNSAGIGGAISAENTINALTFNGTVYFTNNGHCGEGVGTENVNTNKGGGIFLGVNSTFSMLPNTTMYLENNHAILGGAIYVYDASPLSYCVTLVPYAPKEECFFQLPGQNLSNGVDVKLVFKNNAAAIAGSMLFGGVIDNCKLAPGLDSYSSGKVFDKIVYNNDTDYNTASNISSDSLYICRCENNFPNLTFVSKYVFSRTVYPGETFQVSVVVIGQRNGTVTGQVISTIDQGDLPDSQHLQYTNTACTTLSYTVSSLSWYVDLVLRAAHSPCTYGLRILVFLNQTCPPGFIVSKSAQSCVCEPRIQRYTNDCNITNGLGQITRDSSQQFWVGYDNQSDGLILHPHCPFDYCVNDTINFPLNNTEKQCAYNRSGLLCGRCKTNYSLVLGTSRCKKCTNSHLVLLIPFAVMGVALVFFLLVCKLTVATGMLSGLVFYANIVGVNRTNFLPVETTNAFSVFIAWLNLDFGFETCFYNGMDAYSKAWLQFVFPVYIWALVGLMILVSHFSQRFARLLGNNPVSVLATLILLSYAKILRTLIAVFYVTYLEYPEYNKSVWLYDANIDYLVGKHIPLFIVAVIVFLTLFIPYTLVLLFGQWLPAVSHLRVFSWVNSPRLKPFMDSYHAPYKAKHRYWPGLLLLLRFVLLLVFALNPQEDPSVNLLAILVGTGFLVACAWLSGGVYKNWCLDALECSFALNLIILVGATSYVTHSHGNQIAVGYTSVSIAFATLACILAFQLANITGIAKYLKRKCAALKVANMIRNEAEAEVRFPTGSLPDRLINPKEYEQPFHTPQGNATAEPMGVNEAQRRLMAPVYTYGSIN